MPRARQILVVGYFGFGNLGDDAILDATLDHLRRGMSSPPRISVVVGSCENAVRRFGVEPVHWQDAAGISRAVRSADLVVVGGGGLFQDWWGVDPDGLLVPEHWGMGLYAGPAVLAAAFDRPVALHALGVGPLDSDPALGLARAACDAASSITVRDEASRALLASAGVDPGLVGVAADPAFALSLESSPQDDGVRRIAGLAAGDGPVVAAVLRDWDLGVSPSFWEREVARGLDLVVEGHDARVVLVPFQTVHFEREGSPGDSGDAAVAERVRRLMRHAGRAHLLGRPDTPAEAASLLGRCDAVLGMRLHAVILAALGGVPTASLVYDAKVGTCADELRLADLSMEIASVSAEAVSERIGAILDDAGPIRRRMSEGCAVLGARAKEGLARLVDMASGPPRDPRPLTPQLGESLGRLVAAQIGRVEKLEGERQRSDAERERFERELASARDRLAGRTEELRRAEAARSAAEDQARDRQNELQRRQVELDDLSTRLTAENSAAHRENTRLQRVVNGLYAEVARLRSFETELYRWQSSHLWRLGSAYWALLDLLPWRRRARPAPPPAPPAPVPETVEPPAPTEAVAPSPPAPTEALAAPQGQPVDRKRFRLEAQLEMILRRLEHRKGVVVFLPSVGWSIVLFQRPHHLARTFAAQGWVAIFDSSNADYDRVSGFEEIEPDLFLYSGPQELLARLPQPLLWSFTYNFDQVDDYPRDAISVYDWIDDLEVFPQDPELLARNHRRGIREAGVVASVARRLHEQAVKERPDALYLPNGVEYDRFSDTTVAPAEDDALAAMLASGRPVAGYYGALAEWFDYDLLAEVARQRRDWSFVLIGPQYDESLPGQPLLMEPNVIWLGPRDYATLPGYLKLFAVSMIPFKINNITLATSPLKLYEYFAGGTPTVTTPMPECAAYPQVFVATTAQEFAAALDQAREAAGDPGFVERLRALARANSWHERVRDVVRTLDRAPGGPPR